jgi:hypothetical protein
MPIKQRTDDGSVRPANPRPLDPSMPDDGGAGGIATPDGSQPGDEGAPNGGNDSDEEMEVGDPRDGP